MLSMAAMTRTLMVLDGEEGLTVTRNTKFVISKSVGWVGQTTKQSHAWSKHQIPGDTQCCTCWDFLHWYFQMTFGLKQLVWTLALAHQSRLEERLIAEFFCQQLFKKTVNARYEGHYTTNNQSPQTKPFSEGWLNILSFSQGRHCKHLIPPTILIYSFLDQKRGKFIARGT